MSEYCLRWNNHRPNLVTVFSELLTSEALVDVTLATDGHYIHAHKLVLSACSVYFKDLFGANPCKHPIVILKDIRIDDLKTVIDFIYRGEVNVAQDRLQDVLRTAESLRIKGLAENPRGYDDMSSHATRFLGAREATRQRSSLTDSREQSLSLEGEEEGGEPATPPSTKRRKITPSHDSSESVPEEGESEDRGSAGGGGGEARGGSREVKDEPLDEQDLPDRPSREGSEQDTASMGGSQDGVGGGGDDATTTTTTTTPGTSTTDQSMAPHSQGRGGSKRGVLQRQQGIIREGAGTTTSTSVVSEDVKGLIEVKGEAGVGMTVGVGSSATELIVPDTVVVTGGTVTLSTASTLLQVPAALVVAGGREGGLPKQHSHPTPLLHPPTMAKQLSHPEARGPPTHAGAPPAITRQRSHPTVLAHTHTPPSTPGAAAPAQGQHVQVIPYSVLLKQQRPAGGAAPVPAATLRPIQPKPLSAAAEAAAAAAALEAPPKKEVPIIRLTPSEDSVGTGGGGYGGGGPRPLPRAASEEPALLTGRGAAEHGGQELLSAGPPIMVSSVSQDSGLEAGPPVASGAAAAAVTARLGPGASLSALTLGSAGVRAASSPGHCPVLRGGPALGCNFCWNSTDPQGRVLRRKTKYHCPECRTNLCIVPCFHEYHRQIERAQDADKQISKILTKTGSL